MAYRKGKTGRTVALVLCTILSLAAVAGAGTALYYGASENGWFSKEAVEEDDTVTEESTETAGSLYIDDSETTNSGIKLTAARLLSSSLSESYVIKVASYNEDATNPKFSWSCNDTTSVTLTQSDDGFSCTVTLKSAFSEAITIWCTASDVNTSTPATATCTVHYISRLTDASFKFYTTDDDSSVSIAWTSGNSTVTITPNQGNTFWLDSGLNVSTDYEVSRGTGSYDESYINTKTIYSNITNSTISTGSSLREFLANVTGVTYSSDSQFKSGVYNALISSYNSGTAAVTFTLILTGDKSGLTSTYTYNLIINPVNFYVAVSNVSLDQTTIYF